METKLTSVGNSKGIIIPKALIEQCGLKDQVFVEVEGNCLIISALAENPRRTWEKEILATGGSDNDELLMGDYLEHTWDDEEWEW
ncbi:MAG: AbrB/MazE/SpoVT family DNA-binding domain-containing protein [Waterburya sp.]